MNSASQYPLRQQSELNSISCKCLVIASLAFILFSYHKVGNDLFAAWQSEEYSHGMIIPIIALLIAWHRLTATRPIIKPSWYGIIVLAIGGGLQLVGTLAAFETPSEYGLIVALVGLSLAFLGIRVTQTLAPALIYLLFAIPLPRLVYVALSQDLQLISSTLGVWFLDAFGISVFQEGNVIDLGGYKLQVVEACSGLRYLFPLMSFGYLVAYLLEDRLWKRALIFLSAIPITIAMNSLRITLIGITVDIWGISMAEGFLHAFEGWVIFLLCAALLMGEVWIFLRIGARGQFRWEYLGPARGNLFSGHMYLAGPVIVAFVLSGFLAGLFETKVIEERTEILPAHTPFALFPTVLGDWHGRPHNLEAGALHELQLNDYWLADYTGKDSNAIINLYMAYYASQRVGSSAHSPSNCIPGGGWQIANKETRTIALPGGNSVTVSRLLIKRDDATQLVYFWFEERGRDLTENYSAKWYLLLDSIAMGRSDGALIRLVTQLAKGESEAGAEKRLNDFLIASYPVIKTFVPGKTEFHGRSSANSNM